MFLKIPGTIAPMTEEGRRRLAAAVRSARLAQRKTADDVAAAARISAVTYGRIEAGKPVRALTYAAIDDVFGWASGTAEGYVIAPNPLTEEEVRRVLTGLGMDNGQIDTMIRQARDRDTLITPPQKANGNDQSR